jgi:hypothetical protein
VRLRFVLGELEQIQRAFDVDGVRGHRCELSTRGQERGKMKHQFDTELCEHSLEQSAIEDRPGNLAIDLVTNRRVQAVQIERDDGAIAALGEPRDEPVADLATGAGDQHDWFAHPRIIVGRCDSSFPPLLFWPFCSHRRDLTPDTTLYSPAPRCAWITSTPAARNPARPSRSIAS